MIKLIILLVCFTGLWAKESSIIQTKSGQVKGTIRVSYDGRNFSSFEGIPYAKPPVGDLRFKGPIPYKQWTGIWEANTLHTCMQFTMSMTLEGNEDCLYVNVYVPREKIEGTENFDVIVHIHGGAFMVGSASWHMGPEYLMDRDVVFVSFNYRLGVLGFLSTQDDIIPGNNGLKDQTLALKWVQENIGAFGGNPKSVTLTGMSAGGASVHFHYLSPLSKGLFNRGFSQSGTVLNSWALQKAPLEKAKKIGAAVGCVDESSEKLLYCLQHRSGEQISNSAIYLYGAHPFPVAPLGPVVEHNHEGAFLPDHPYKLIQNGLINDVPWITSLATEEGHFPTVFLLEELWRFDMNWADIVPHMLEFNYTVPDTDKKQVADKIRQHYFRTREINTKHVDTIVKLCSDRLFTMDAEKAARLQAKFAKSPVYFYIIGFPGEHSLVKQLSSEKLKGVSHGDDALFYLYPSFGQDKLLEPVEQMKDMFLDMLVTYSKTGVPKFGEVEWKPVKYNGDFIHLFIKDPQNISVEEVKELGPSEFWKSIGLRENENLFVVDQKDEL